MRLLRRFRDAGLEEFRAYLVRLKENRTLAPPEFLLEGPEFSEPLVPSVRAEPRSFENRFVFAAWLDDTFRAAGAEAPRATDVKFWSWLTLFLFDQVCPAGADGGRKPRAEARYIPDPTRWNRRYRHLLANPYDVYLLHRDNPARAMVVLANPLHRPGELTEQFTSRLEVVQCPGTMALATHLYIDPETGRPRRGASGKKANRFGKLMNQYARTWDLPEINVTDFTRTLPRDFRRFVQAAVEGDQADQAQAG